MPKVEDDTLELLKNFQIPQPRDNFVGDIVAQAKAHQQTRIQWLNPLRQLRAFFHIPRFRQMVVYGVVVLAIAIGIMSNPPSTQKDVTMELAALDAETLYVETSLIPDVIFASTTSNTPPADPLSDMDFDEDDWIESLSL